MRSFCLLRCLGLPSPPSLVDRGAKINCYAWPEFTEHSLALFYAWGMPAVVLAAQVVHIISLYFLVAHFCLRSRDCSGLQRGETLGKQQPEMTAARWRGLGAKFWSILTRVFESMFSGPS